MLNRKRSTIFILLFKYMDYYKQNKPSFEGLHDTFNLSVIMHH